MELAQKQSNSYYRAPFILTEKGKEIAINTLAKIEEFMKLFGVFEDERKRDAFYLDLHKVENSQFCNLEWHICHEKGIMSMEKNGGRVVTMSDVYHLLLNNIKNKKIDYILIVGYYIA